MHPARGALAKGSARRGSLSRRGRARSTGRVDRRATRDMDHDPCDGGPSGDVCSWAARTRSTASCDPSTREASKRRQRRRRRAGAARGNRPGAPPGAGAFHVKRSRTASHRSKIPRTRRAGEANARGSRSRAGRARPTDRVIYSRGSPRLCLAVPGRHLRFDDCGSLPRSRSRSRSRSAAVGSSAWRALPRRGRAAVCQRDAPLRGQPAAQTDVECGRTFCRRACGGEVVASLVGLRELASYDYSSSGRELESTNRVTGGSSGDVWGWTALSQPSASGAKHALAVETHRAPASAGRRALGSWPVLHVARFT